MRSGVAREPITDMGAYLRRLEAMLSRSREVMSVVIEKARRDPKRIVFPEGEHPKILRAAKILAEEGICRPILLAREAEVESARARAAASDGQDRLHQHEPLREARRRTRGGSRSCGAASGMTARGGRAAGARPQRLRPAHAGRRRRRRRDLGHDAVLPGHDPAGAPDLRHRAGRAEGVGSLHPDAQAPDLFFADTTVNIDPTAEELAEIALLTARRRPPLRHGAAGRDDLVLQLRLEHARERAEGQESRRAREGGAAGPPDRRRDAGRLRRRARDARGRVPVGDASRTRTS